MVYFNSGWFVKKNDNQDRCITDVVLRVAAYTIAPVVILYGAAMTIAIPDYLLYPASQTHRRTGAQSEESYCRC